jgi:hypothetical protein
MVKGPMKDFPKAARFAIATFVLDTLAESLKGQLKHARSCLNKYALNVNDAIAILKTRNRRDNTRRSR